MKYILLTTTILFTLALGNQVSTCVNRCQQRLGISTRNFAQRLYRHVGVGKDNVVYSPYSIHSLLTMTSAGARGNTLSEMRSVLGLPSSGLNAHLAYSGLIARLNHVARVELCTSNTLFISPSKRIKTAFIHEVRQKYFSTVKYINFQAVGGPEKEINDYVAEKTNNVIREFMSPNSIEPNTEMVLVNTIFFNGTWKNPFNKYATEKQDFYQLDGTKKKLDMMQGTKTWRYKRDNSRNFDVLEMPFDGNRFSLNIVLPRANTGITALENNLLREVGNIFDDLKSTYLNVGIPKFNITTKFDLKSALFQMGMVDPFIPGTADFTGITNDNCYINSVIHQAQMDVSETGTIAAAATGVLTSRSLVLTSPSASFIANHPFLFFLRGKITGQILFQGKFSG